jgi:ABC-type multidrug transport system permease subunit
MIKRFWVMFIARNREFFRDRAGFGWNILFPFLLVAGFGVIFGAEEPNLYKIGVYPVSTATPVIDQLNLPPEFLQTRYLQFVGFQTIETGLDKLRHHQIDFLVRTGQPPYPFWVSDTNPKGYLMEKIFKASLNHDEITAKIAIKKQIQGQNIRYIDWLFPGILGMNMMFSALWGVGYVVVRYRKTGVLKRLMVTPLTAFEYLAAQLVSRLFIMVFSVLVVWIGCDLIFKFQVHGSYLSLFVVFLAGSIALSALGLLLASRGTSEELVSGVLNFIAWPMMFLSEVWFSLEGAPAWVRGIAQIFPLTHLLKAIRRVMNDGASLIDVGPEMIILLLFAGIFLAAGAALFSWNK